MSFLKKCSEVNTDRTVGNNMGFANKVGNDAHNDWLQWSQRYSHVANFRAKISHDKTHVDFNDDQALAFFEETWKKYYRRIF
jgi:hypothetical protein